MCQRGVIRIKEGFENIGHADQIVSILNKMKRRKKNVTKQISI